MKTYSTQWFTRTGRVFAGPRIQAADWAEALTAAEMRDVCLVGELKNEAGGGDE